MSDKTWLLAVLDPLATDRPVKIQLPPNTDEVRAYDPLTATSQKLVLEASAGAMEVRNVLLSDSPRVFVVRLN